MSPVAEEVRDHQSKWPDEGKSPKNGRPAITVQDDRPAHARLWNESHDRRLQEAMAAQHGSDWREQAKGLPMFDDSVNDRFLTTQEILQDQEDSDNALTPVPVKGPAEQELGLPVFGKRTPQDKPVEAAQGIYSPPEVLAIMSPARDTDEQKHWDASAQTQLAQALDYSHQ